MNLIGLLSVVGVVSTLLVSMAGESKEHSQPSVPVTLLMDWTRGDLTYGPNFVQLQTNCQTASDDSCKCIAAFYGADSEFASYVESFSDKKVPVTYDVLYGANGQARGARLARVGTCQSSKFGKSDGLITIRFTSRNRPGHAHARLPANCSPALNRK
jgi:hypothetical protein